MISLLSAVLLLSSALLAIWIGAAIGRAKVQRLNAPPPAPAQPPAEPFVPQTFTRRQIQMRIDRVEGALTMSTIRTPVVVNSLDGHAFYVTCLYAGIVVDSVRSEIEVMLGDNDFTIIEVPPWA